MQIKKFLPEYIKEVSELEKICFPKSPWSENMFLNELKNPLCEYYVAKEDKKITGYVGMWCVVDEGQITNIAVLPEYRGKGVATALLFKLFERAKEKGITKLTLEVRASNNTAISLYEKNGFYKTGERKGYYADCGEDAILMDKKL